MTISDGAVLQLKIVLFDPEAPLFRCIRIPSACTFWDLEVWLRNAVEELDMLMVFEAEDPATGEARYFATRPQSGFASSILPCRDHRVTDYISLERPDFRCHHLGMPDLFLIRLEAVLPANPEQPCPSLVYGAGVIPPSDYELDPDLVEDIDEEDEDAGAAEFLPDDDVQVDIAPERVEAMVSRVDFDRAERMVMEHNPEPIDPSQIAFDDPEDEGIWHFIEEKVLSDAIDSFYELEPPPDQTGRYTILFPGRLLDLLLEHHLLPQNVRIQRSEKPPDSPLANVWLSRTEIAECLDAINIKMFETHSPVLRRRLDRIPLYLDNLLGAIE